MLSKENAGQLEVGLDFEELENGSGMNYFGIKQPPVQMISHYYQQSNQLQLIQQTFSAQSRAGSSQNSKNLNLQQAHGIGAAQSYELQTAASYYSRKNARSSGSNTKSFVSGVIPSTADHLNTPSDNQQRTNSNRAANGSNLGAISNGDNFPIS